ncbi:MAG: four helix bundle protein [Bacteroidales bacterium]
MQTNLISRLINFSVSVLALAENLGFGQDVRPIRSQIIRSATSVGANYQESQAASSRADFINKLQIALKELMETIYWLVLIQKKYGDSLQLQEIIDPILKESEALRKILSSCILTAKQNNDKNRNLK